jgi:hypothetical protein
MLREFDVSDASGMYALNLDPDVLRYTGDVPFPSVEEAAAFLKNYGEYQKIGMSFWKNAPCQGLEDSEYYVITVLEPEKREFKKWRSPRSTFFVTYNRSCVKK